MAGPTTQDLLGLFGWGALPTTGSGQGAYGDYSIQLTGDPTTDYQQYAGQGWSPLEGTAGGFRVVNMGNPNQGNDFLIGDAGPDTYQISYTPDYAGSRLAENQAIAANDREAGLMQAIGMLMIGAGIGGFYPTGAESAAGAGAAAAGGVDGAVAAVNGGMPLSEAASTFGLTDAQMAAVSQQVYGGVGATYGGVGSGTLAGVGSAGFDAAALDAFNSGNTLGPGGTPGTLAPDSYWNPVTQTEMPYGEVGSTPMTADAPWYEKLWDAATTPGGTLGKAAISFLANTLMSPQQNGGSGGGLGNPFAGGSSGGGGSSAGGSGGQSQAGSITPQQLALPSFTRWDSPLGIEYHGLQAPDGSLIAGNADPFAQAQQTWNPMAAALRNF